MREKRQRETHGGRIFIPVLVGFLVVGASFVWLALSSQRSLASPSMSTSLEVAGAAQLWLSHRSQTISANDPAVTKALAPSEPVSLDIGAIDVHSELHDVGLDQGGAIETPSGDLYDQAAWYRHSPAPGSMGPAVLLGHVDSFEGPSVFFRLGELVPGDRVSVTRADGTVARFIIESVHRYSKDDFPTKLVYGDIDHAGLRLITCGGEFDTVAGHYEDNIVVFARLDLGPL